MLQLQLIIVKYLFLFLCILCIVQCILLLLGLSQGKLTVCAQSLVEYCVTQQLVASFCAFELRNVH